MKQCSRFLHFTLLKRLFLSFMMTKLEIFTTFFSNIISFHLISLRHTFHTIFTLVVSSCYINLLSVPSELKEAVKRFKERYLRFNFLGKRQFEVIWSINLSTQIYFEIGLLEFYIWYESKGSSIVLCTSTYSIFIQNFLESSICRIVFQGF